MSAPNVGLVVERGMCCGCGACSSVCPVSAICMEEDKDGFVRPVLSRTICTECGQCKDVCPVVAAENGWLADGASGESCFAVRLRKCEELSSVSSGGAFWAFAETTIEKGGVVYGAAQDGIGKVVHHRAETIDEARAFRRSKYLQSDTTGVFRLVRRDLESGRTVLFSGTGCQVAAVWSFVGRRHDRLLTCEVVCHGIPSMKAWRSYLQEREHAAGKKVTEVVFRDKSLGWRSNQYRIVYDDGSEELEQSAKNAFHSGYLRGLFYRESCGSCPFASLPRVADVTLADFWKYTGPLAEDNRGVSLVVANTDAGRALVDAAAHACLVEPVSRESAIASCRHLTHAPAASPDRRRFLDELSRVGYHAAAAKFARKREAKSLASRVLSGVVRRIRGMQDSEARRAVREYWAMLGKRAVFPGMPLDMLRLVAGPTCGAVVVSDGRRARKIAKRRGFELVSWKKSAAEAPRQLAMRDAFLLLAKKGVNVWFCNRVGRIKDADWRYSDSAERRIGSGLSFPVMYADIAGHESDLRELFGDRYSPEYVEGIGRIPQIVKVGDVSRHLDCSGPLVNVVNGRRATCYQPTRFTRTVHVYGRCGAFGYAVEDADTLPSRIQKELAGAGFSDVRVVNHGLWGGDDRTIDSNFLHELDELDRGDVVLFYRKHLDRWLMKAWSGCGVRYLDITREWHSFPESKWCFYDRPGHMNAAGYANAARLIVRELVERKFEGEKVPENRLEHLSVPRLTAYLKQSASDGGAIAKYLDSVKSAMPPLREGQMAGAIVMNCNPFTNGHRYLIERAAAEVDRLYIFVVEEDRSQFRFADRLEMVKAGVADIGNAAVFPSGRFMISTQTFPEYFMKDYVREKDFDVSSDVRTFGERIAPALGISVRFAGEEPSDPVTANYNRSMSEMLPRLGVRFVEIPRAKLADGRVISATEVRRLLSAGGIQALSAYVPGTTLRILADRYAPDGKEAAK